MDHRVKSVNNLAVDSTLESSASVIAMGARVEHMAQLWLRDEFPCPCDARGGWQMKVFSNLAMLRQAGRRSNSIRRVGDIMRM